MRQQAQGSVGQQAGLRVRRGPLALVENGLIAADLLPPGVQRGQLIVPLFQLRALFLQFGPHGGGYETRLTSYSNLEVSAGTQIVEALLALARTMTPGPVPAQPKVPAPGAPWEYGSVPPEL